MILMENNRKILRVYDSLINKRLKIVKKDGKKLLDTKNTNYSYGTLVDVLEYGLDNIPMPGITSVLLLGMGAGSIIKSLRSKYNCYAPIVGVEMDPVVIDIARNEFGVEADKSLEIYCMDAWDYIENSKKQFDLVILDIFVDVQVSKKFYEPKFWQLLEKKCHTKWICLVQHRYRYTGKQG